ncbi:MAG: diguanylate cyclase [Armatimonadetes bacterium]|nr:diguanylate cyclase [Armatimonadota bacterium]
MANHDSRAQLAKLLKEFGISTLESREAAGAAFPLEINLCDGDKIILDLPAPALISSFDPNELGVAIIDPLGYPARTWGIAVKVPFFRPDMNLLKTPLAGLMEGGAHAGHGALYYDGVRYFSARSSRGGNEIFVLMVNAQEEKRAKGQATKGWRVANILKRLGKALTMHVTVSQTCIAAAHEIASSADLAATLIWTCDPNDPDCMELVASVGVNRKGTEILGRLSVNVGQSCIADLVASRREPLIVDNVIDNLLSANLEAKFCYLRAGAVCCLPLIICDRLVGVIEMIGKEGDVNFLENSEIFPTLAEHLALAINSSQMYELAEKWASHDALTGIRNHRSMQEFLHVRTIEAERTHRALSVVMVDVDHFRSFNEEEGHEAGDEVLRQVAEVLRRSVRPYDMAARYGGEEFTLILPNATAEEAATLCDRIRQEIEAIQYFTRSGALRHISASFGVADIAMNGAEPQGLIRAADGALYEAKRQGRNRVVIAAPGNESIPRREVVDVEKAMSRLRQQDRAQGEKLLARLNPTITKLAEELQLTSVQTLILRALIMVFHGYRNAFEAGGYAGVESLDKSEEFRLLLPGLQGAEERYDGTGPNGLSGTRIPLLGRILAVLVEVAENEGKGFLSDPGRFDPALVAVITRRANPAA